MNTDDDASSWNARADYDVVTVRSHTVSNAWDAEADGEDVRHKPIRFVYTDVIFSKLLKTR